MSSHQPGPSTCSRQDTMSRHSTRTTSQFPFSRLPPELRLDILEVYALPRQPICYSEHALSRQYYGIRLWDFMRMMPEFWCLRQVNREARQVVLRGRQAVRSTFGSVFVDWEHDVFVATLEFPGAFACQFTRLISPLPFHRNIRWLHLSLWFLRLDMDREESIRQKLHNTIADMPALRGLYLLANEGILRRRKLHVRAREELLQHLNRIKRDVQGIASTISGRTISCKIMVVPEREIMIGLGVVGPAVLGTSRMLIYSR
ncbi:hypothetical protein GGR51DRAFT_17024 [Nemania sp. FL0031]|nr:hypothetical protein GGR51DRAFT_17024 [Nemania sp. FL0031]